MCRLCGPSNPFPPFTGIAGNIIPAIATTNAIVAGQEVMELLKILKNGIDAIPEVCKTSYCLRSKSRKGYFLQPSSLAPPSATCYVCKNAQVTVSLDTATWTMEVSKPERRARR